MASRADFIVRIIQDFLNSPHGIEAKEIVVLTFYQAQKRLLGLKLREANIPTNKDGIEVKTVDSSQGSQRGIIIMDFVVANSGAKEDFVSKFVRNDNRVNVAISRAQDALILVGHQSTLIASWKSGNNIKEADKGNVFLVALIQHLGGKDGIVSVGRPPVDPSLATPLNMILARDRALHPYPDTPRRPMDEINPQRGPNKKPRTGNTSQMTTLRQPWVPPMTPLQPPPETGNTSQFPPPDMHEQHRRLVQQQLAQQQQPQYQYVQQFPQQFPPRFPQQFPPQFPQQSPQQSPQQFPQQLPQQLPQQFPPQFPQNSPQYGSQFSPQPPQPPQQPQQFGPAYGAVPPYPQQPSQRPRGNPYGRGGTGRFQRGGRGNNRSNR